MINELITDINGTTIYHKSCYKLDHYITWVYNHCDVLQEIIFCLVSQIVNQKAVYVSFLPNIKEMYAYHYNDKKKDYVKLPWFEPDLLKYQDTIQKIKICLTFL